jgi:hypothetical protein
MQDKPDKNNHARCGSTPRQHHVAIDTVMRHRRARATAASCAAEDGLPLLPRASRQEIGQIIGFATEDIAPGAHVHTHNCSFAEFERDYAFAEDCKDEPLLPPEARATFQGYRRANGKAGTRNYIGVLSSVNCSASVARFMAEAVTRSGILEQYPNIDGVVSFVHGTGCGLAGEGEGTRPELVACRPLAAHSSWARLRGVPDVSRLATDGLVRAPAAPMTIQTRAAPGAIRPASPASRDAARQQVWRDHLRQRAHPGLQCGKLRRPPGITTNPPPGRQWTPWAHAAAPSSPRRRKSRRRAPAHPPRWREVARLVGIIRWWRGPLRLRDGPWTTTVPATAGRSHH